jgi:hypothetical protein
MRRSTFPSTIEDLPRCEKETPAINRPCRQCPSNGTRVIEPDIFRHRRETKLSELADTADGKEPLCQIVRHTKRVSKAALPVGNHLLPRQVTRQTIAQTQVLEVR